MYRAQIKTTILNFKNLLFMNVIADSVALDRWPVNNI